MGEPVREDKIAQALIGSGVQVVVLSACESSKTAPTSDALTHGLAQSISALGVPHVIGMRESIMDLAGIQFARTLCDELAQHERIDSALQTARAAIQKPLKDIARREAELTSSAELSFGQWCLPMLLSPSPAAGLDRLGLSTAADQNEKCQ
ncbi:MAG: CHAT domain-containing protein [Anaerolineales bacterium]|nr:CHAT domain-containing protein [Anaerolineales bacterium]